MFTQEIKLLEVFTENDETVVIVKNIDNDLEYKLHPSQLVLSDPVDFVTLFWKAHRLLVWHDSMGGKDVREVIDKWRLAVAEARVA